MDYDAIVIGGTRFDFNGRPLGPYRLRTACKNKGYEVKVIDFAFALNTEQMITLLKSLITDKTIVLGISTAWLSLENRSNQWFNHGFFLRVKFLFPKLKIVVGGTRNMNTDLAYESADWRVTGFADIAFPLLLDHISKKGPKVKFILDKNLKKTIHSDQLYDVRNMDDIETVLVPEDNFLKYQPFTIELGRGCIFKCAFCSHPFLGKKTYEYLRSPESVASELKRNYELFGMTRYMIADDTFNDSMEKLNRLERAIELSGIPSFEFTCYLRGELLVTKKEMIPKLVSLGLKGYHIGIESFNEEARKVVGKGMDVQRVLDAVEKINSTSSARGHTSMILGLPGDTYEDFYKWGEFFEKNVDKLFASWRFNALGITRPQDDTTYSLIEKDPAKYGYRLWKGDNQQYYNWVHSGGVNSDKAMFIADELNEKGLQFMKIGGWDVATAWFHGFTDQEIKDNYARNIFDWAKKISKKRAQSNFKKITGRDLSTDHL